MSVVGNVRLFGVQYLLTELFQIFIQHAVTGRENGYVFVMAYAVVFRNFPAFELPKETDGCLRYIVGVRESIFGIVHTVNVFEKRAVEPVHLLSVIRQKGAYGIDGCEFAHKPDVMFGDRLGIEFVHGTELSVRQIVN